MERQYTSLLRSRRAEIRNSWERLLRLERGVSPLAAPDVLVGLIEPNLDDFFMLLEGPALPFVPNTNFAQLCPCGQNPLLEFYRAGREAVREAFVWAESDLLEDTTLHRDVAFSHLEVAFETLAREHISAFCAVCRNHITKRVKGCRGAFRASVC